MLADLKFALRMLWRSPGITVAAVLTLALGIGANSAIFSVVDGVLFRPLPYPQSQQLARVYRTATRFGWNSSPFSWLNYKDLLAQNRVFENVGVWTNRDANLSGDGAPERVLVRFASSTLLPTLGVAPIVGRNFLPTEELAGNERVAMLDFALAQRRFGSAAEALGKSVRLNDVDCQIVGVLPRGFRFERPADVWMPASTSLDMTARRNAGFLQVLARKKPAVSDALVAADLAAFSKYLTDTFPDLYPPSTGVGTRAESLLAATVGDVRLPLFVLLGAVAFVLLIACANVANLLLARAAVRQREMAIRAALGARPRRLVRQLLTESLLLAVAGGALGLLFAAWAVDALVSLAPDTLPRGGDVALDVPVLAFTAAVALATGVAFGLTPALAASRPDLHDVLKDGTRGTSSGRGRLRPALVVGEVALSLVLLVGTGLMVRSFVRLRSVDPGFRADHALTLSMSLATDNRVSDADRDRFVRTFNDAVTRLHTLPGVTAVGGINVMPLSDNTPDMQFQIDGFAPADKADEPNCQVRYVTGDWFAAMGIPIMRGRGFIPSDARRSAPVLVVNQAWVAKYSPDRGPVGRHIRPQSSEDEQWATIVGVIGDVRTYGLDVPARPEIYWPLAQRRDDSVMTMIVRTTGNPQALAGAARAALAEVDAAHPVFDVELLEDVVAESLAQRRFTLTLMLLFGVVALILAAVGIYGVMAYTVAQRTQEIGIRVALGASAATVLCMVLGDGMKLVGLGLLLGGVAAALLTPVGASLLWGVSSTDVPTYLVIAAVLAAVALVAIVIPARRATRIDPMQALRSD